MPYVTQQKRVGLREPIDEHTAEMRKIHIEPTSSVERVWNSETFKQMVEDDLVYLFCLAKGELDFGGGRVIAIDTPLPRVTRVLRDRRAEGQQIGGDLNFCACRYLVGLTEIHLTPKYEDKIQWIQERIETVKLRFSDTRLDRSPNKTALGILQCVSLELYARYAIEYEIQKRIENGDIME